MSLLKHIYIAKDDPSNNRIGGWRHFDTWNLATLNFETREQAEQAYSDTRAVYDDIVENQTWKGQQNQEMSPVATEVSFRHHMWIDENDDGFTLCVSFDKGAQTRDFMKRTKDTIGEMKIDSFKILQGVSDQINKYMTATHSVEVDVLSVDYEDGVRERFEQAALTMKEQQALYADLTERSALGVKRLKAYFDTEEAAENFARYCEKDVKISIHNDPVIRRFPAAKADQPKRLVA